MKTIHAKFAAVLSAMLLTAGTVLGATAEEQQFQQLKEQHAKSASAPGENLNKRYQWSLEQLFHKATQSGQLELARQLQAEIQAVAGATAAAAVAAPRGAIIAPTKPPTKLELKRLFEGSVWQFYEDTAATPGKLRGTFTFLKDGSFTGPRSDGWDHHHFFDVTAPDVLKIYGRNPAKNRKEPFRGFRVDFSAKTAKTDMSLGGTAVRDGFIGYDKPVK